MSAVEETLARISKMGGVEAYVIADVNGALLRHSKGMSTDDAERWGKEVHALTALARRTVRDLDPKNELSFFRVRLREKEILAAPGADFLVVVIQKWMPFGLPASQFAPLRGVAAELADAEPGAGAAPAAAAPASAAPAAAPSGDAGAVDDSALLAAPTSWFGEAAALFAGIEKDDGARVRLDLLYAAATKTGAAYDFIFSPGSMVSGVLVGDLKTNLKGVTDYDAASGRTAVFFDALCEAEVAAKGLEKVKATKASGTVSGLWLLRHLLFVTRFIELLAAGDDVAPSDAARRTYDEVLKPYHGFLLGGVVSAAMALAPSRATFFANIGVAPDAARPEVAAFLRHALPVVRGRLKAFYDERGWYFTTKA